MLNLHSSSIPRTTLALCPTIIRREIGQATLTNDSPLGISERDLQTDKVEAIASVDGEVCEGMRGRGRTRHGFLEEDMPTQANHSLPFFN
ncbi:hypothetical protein BLNAU_20663 [Blattamonas nauphoetae]|uniref:Uncharacterized protein n=1 Tax=Blattamonas nauphoetae TaxID=2049346 RepID=A0ABQ9WY09_9EUKA|nr:hypothetical protein BLNAU_20663 [Blattamonas nauphoetae]